MPWIAAVAAIAGTAVSVGSQVMAGQAQAAQGRQMQKAEEMNALVSRNNAEAIRQSGQFEIDKQRRENARFIGTQRARIAGSGVKFSGSPLDLMSDTIAEQEMDIAATQYNTDIAAKRALNQADYSTMLGENYNKMGGIGQMESYVKAGSTLLTEGANTANKYFGAFKYKTPALKVGGPQ